MANEPRISNWTKATVEEGRLELIGRVIQETRQYYELWGCYPTAVQIAAQLGFRGAEHGRA